MNIIKLNTIGDIVKKVEGSSAPIANQSKEVVITENGTTTIKPDAGYTGLGKVKVTVDTPIISNQEKLVYFASDEDKDIEVVYDADYSGLSKVTISFRKEIDKTKYLTIEALEDGLVLGYEQGRQDIEYCIDGSGFWYPLPWDGIPAITSGQSISLRGNVETGGLVGNFNINKKCNLSGNIMSLLYKDNSDDTSLPLPSYAFQRTFKNCRIVDASSLIIPAQTLSTACYREMFCNCSELVSAPSLPATTLAYACYEGMFKRCYNLINAPTLYATELKDYCYRNMFDGCSKLSYIKAMFISTPQSAYTYRWLYGVKAEGTFVKNAAATWDVTGSNGVPTGWTVETATE